MISKAGKEVVDVTRPRDRLENLFLRIVEEASHRQRAAGGGVTSGGRLASFLTGDEQPVPATLRSGVGPDGRRTAGQQVIESLLAGSEQRPEQTETPPAPSVSPEAPTQADGDVLEDLLSSKPVSETGDGEQTPPGAKPPDSSSADRDVIEGLLGEDGQKKGDAGGGPPV